MPVTTPSSATNLLKLRTLKNLLKDWDETEKSNDPGIFTVREWIMNELEIRKPKAFAAWMEATGDVSPRDFF